MKDKNSNIEVLKIICMINIIVHHSFAHSILQIDLSNINFIILYVINIFGKISNNIFILITVYFMINKKIKPMHIVKIVLETWFYSYAILIISALVLKKINIDDVNNGDEVKKEIYTIASKYHIVDTTVDILSHTYQMHSTSNNIKREK